MATATGSRARRGKLKSRLVPMKDNGRGFPVGFVRIAGGLYQLDPSDAKADGLMGWIKVTQLKAPRPSARAAGSSRYKPRRRKSASAYRGGARRPASGAARGGSF